MYIKQNITNYELQTTNYKLRITNYDLDIPYENLNKYPNYA